ncbi:uncharacterized protein JCM15063_002910 [Sporobolomyces koalae]|uniref:uncharacterized protein n=1 Tax=Sporobolomyces koalae TaxID=500713 RepID=UPI003177D95E
MAGRPDRRDDDSTMPRGNPAGPAQGSPSATTASPIAIVSPGLSYPSSAHSFNLRSPPSASSFSPTTGDSAALLDGPLTDLLPSTTGSPTSASSTEEARLPAGGWSYVKTPAETGTERRRIVSAPLGLYATSPPRSSPLSQSFSSIFDEPALPRTSVSPSHSLARPVPIAGSFSAHRRRRSSASAQHPLFGSLVGSFENSLLSGRMSAHPSKPLPFTCSIGVLGSKDAPKKLQCPRHLHVGFGAVFYSSKEDRNTSPYVGTIDLEGHYVSMLESASHSDSKRLPKFPGYQVPVRGQLQLVLKNQNQTAVKPFLIPYDLEGLNRRGQGGRTFLRQKSYAIDPTRSGPEEKGKLRFAVHLTFCSPPLSHPGKKGTLRSSTPKYYLYQSVRVVFASQALDATEKVRVVLEGPAEMLFGPAAANLSGFEDEQARLEYRESLFGEYREPSEEWEVERRKVRAESVRREASDNSNNRDVTDSSMSTFTRIPAPPPTAAIRASTNPAFATVSTAGPPALPPHHCHPLSISTTFSSPVSPVLSSLHPEPEPLTFDRVPSPISQDLVRLPSRERKQSLVSGLSLSRPNSPATFRPARADEVAGPPELEPRQSKTHSRERELCGR